MKHKKPIDFHLDCNCFLQAEQGIRAQGMDMIGVRMFVDKVGNTGLSMAVASRIVGPKGERKQGEIFFNFCPFCGKQITTRQIILTDGGKKNDGLE